MPLKEPIVADVRLTADRRTEFGKGGARRTRRAGKIPAVLYGHGAEPQHLALPAREFTLAVRRNGANVLLTLVIDGEEALAIPKALQRHVIRNEYEHVDLLAVRRGEKLTVDVALRVVGDAVPGALLQQEHSSLSVNAEATHIPTEFEIDISGVEVGTQITAAQVELPDGVELAGDPDQVLVHISEAPTAEEMEGETEAGASEAGAEEERAEATGAGAGNDEAAGTDA
jgi:large subunit ribosomal protein L25